MKKLLLLIFVFMLSACSSKYYTISFGDETIIVGKDDSSGLSENIDSYEIVTDDKGNEYLSKIVIYLADLDTDIKIDDYTISKGIKDTCVDLNGEYIENNGEACLISKTIRKKTNSIALYGDLLSDDVDSINRIEVSYN